MLEFWLLLVLIGLRGNEQNFSVDLNKKFYSKSWVFFVLWKTWNRTSLRHLFISGFLSFIWSFRFNSSLNFFITFRSDKIFCTILISKSIDWIFQQCSAFSRFQTRNKHTKHSMSFRGSSASIFSLKSSSSRKPITLLRTKPPILSVTQETQFGSDPIELQLCATKFKFIKTSSSWIQGDNLFASFSSGKISNIFRAKWRRNAKASSTKTQTSGRKRRTKNKNESASRNAHRNPSWEIFVRSSKRIQLTEEK